jgi:hypothetical protein
MVISRLNAFTQTRGDDPRAFHTTLNSLDRSHRRSTLAFNTDVALSTHTTTSNNSGAFWLAWAVLENATMPIANTVPAHAIRRNLTALSI